MDERFLHSISTTRTKRPRLYMIEVSGSDTEQYESYDTTLLSSCGLLDEEASHSGDDLTEGMQSIGSDPKEEMQAVASGSTGEFQMHIIGSDSNELEAAIGSGS